MGELLLELLFLFAELFGEVFIELAAAGLLDSVFRGIARAFNAPWRESPARAAIRTALLGIMMGGLSLLVAPHPLVRPSRIRGVSLVVSPVITGLLLSLVGAALRRRGKAVVQIESFGYGFTFAFGMALVRFLLAK